MSTVAIIIFWGITAVLILAGLALFAAALVIRDAAGVLGQ